MGCFIQWVTHKKDSRASLIHIKRCQQQTLLVGVLERTGEELCITAVCAIWYSAARVWGRLFGVGEAGLTLLQWGWSYHLQSGTAPRFMPQSWATAVSGKLPERHSHLKTWREAQRYKGIRLAAANPASPNDPLSKIPKKTRKPAYGKYINLHEISATWKIYGIQLI